MRSAPGRGTARGDGLGRGNDVEVELLVDLRERIWAHYQLVLLEHYRQDHLTQVELSFDDPSF